MAKKKRWGSVYLALVLLFLYAPIILLIIYSFNENKTMASWGGFSLKWYIELFRDREIKNALWVTLTIATLSSVIAAVIGTAAAIGIRSMGKKRRNAILMSTNLPVINPDLVTGISLMLLFTAIKMELGYVTLLLAHIAFNVPYVILSVMPKLRQTSELLYEAALDQGATPLYAIRKVILPDIMPGIVTGTILAFTLSLDDFVISFFTQQRAQNLSILIYSMARRGIKPTINALSAIIFVVVLLLLLIINIRSIKQEQKTQKQMHVRS